MAKNVELNAIGYIIRGEKKIKISDLPPDEQKRLSAEWNHSIMKAAGCIQHRR